jgi:hypothetical protein
MIKKQSSSLSSPNASHDLWSSTDSLTNSFNDFDEFDFSVLFDDEPVTDDGTDAASEPSDVTVKYASILSQKVDKKSTPIWKYNLSHPNEDRKAFILHAPVGIQEYVNSGNFRSLTALFEELCTPDCSLRTRVLVDVPNAKSLLVEMFMSLHRTFPDYATVMHSGSMSTKRRQLIYYASCSGSKLFCDSYDFLYNTLDSDAPGVISEILREKARLIESTGANYTVHNEAKVTWVLTPDCSRVRKIVISTNVVDVRPIKLGMYSS